MNEKNAQDSSIPVDELTPEQVRRELLALEGYRLEKAIDKDPDVWNAYHRDRYIGATFGGSLEEAWTTALDNGLYSDDGGHNDEQLPNWCEDTGAALDVCMKIGGGVYIEPDGEGFWCCFPKDDETINWHAQAHGTTIPDALARLAHVALRGGAK